MVHAHNIRDRLKKSKMFSQNVLLCPRTSLELMRDEMNANQADRGCTVRTVHEKASHESLSYSSLHKDYVFVDRAFNTFLL